jgi:uncharacterized membrane protein
MSVGSVKSTLGSPEGFSTAPTIFFSFSVRGWVKKIVFWKLRNWKCVKSRSLPTTSQGKDRDDSKA